jgi:predicted phosphodiesterase
MKQHLFVSTLPRAFYAIVGALVLGTTSLLAQTKTVDTRENFTSEAAVGHPVTPIEGLKTLKNGLSFLVMGDWGRHGETKQKQVAESMSRAAVGLEAQFIVSTGDNFYPKGVASVTDPSWQSSFEQVYTQHPLFIDWQVVLGNHDYKSNPEAQIAYSQLSERWKLPAKYYSFTKKLDKEGKATAEFFCIDTNPFQLDYYSNDEYAAQMKRQDTAAQRLWLENALRKSTATWKIVVGHHPLYSSGKRMGKTGDMENAFASFFERHGVDVYFCGHEHHLEYDQFAGRKLHHFVSGAGSEAGPVRKAPYTVWAGQAFGFMTATMTDKEMLVQVINEKGEILYNTVLKK